MNDLDDIDMEILRLLVADARRPYNEIAAEVDRSPPTVSERIDRLQELGVVRRFTVDVDRSQLRTGTPVLVTVEPDPSAADEVRDALAAADGVEHVFLTADASVVFQASVPDGDVRRLLDRTVGCEVVREFDVALLTDVDWQPSVDGTEFALECAECGNTVTAEGESVTIDGERYHFCCESCEARFEDRYEALQEGI